MTLNFTLDDKRGDLSAHLSGTLDFAAHGQIRALLAQVPQTPPGRSMMLDLAGLTHLDTAGLGLLLVMRDEMAGRHGTLRLTGAGGEVLRVLQVSGFAELLTAA